MAFGTVPLGTANRIYVGTVAPPATLIGGLVSWDYPGNRDTATQAFYNLFPSIITVGEPTYRIDLTLKYAKSDTGQDVIKTGFDGATVVYCSILIDTTTGEYLPSYVAQWHPSGRSSTDAADLTVTLVGNGSPVDVAGGY